MVPESPAPFVRRPAALRVVRVVRVVLLPLLAGCAAASTAPEPQPEALLAATEITLTQMVTDVWRPRVGEQIPLGARVNGPRGEYPADGDVLTREVRWASSNTTVATVSAAGVVTGRRPGRATIVGAVTTRRGLLSDSLAYQIFDR